MTKISFIYFDVGGVVLLDYSGTNKWQEMKDALGVTHETDSQFEYIWSSHRKEICLDYDVEQYVQEFRELGLPIPEGYSMLQDFVDRYDPNPYIWPVISYARSKYQIGLLTNMYPRLLQTIYAREDLNIDHKWDHIVDSSKVMAQKPDRKIFEIAQDRAGFQSDEILFIDNQQKHLDGAKSLGWRAFLYDSAQPKQSSDQLFEFLSNL